MSDKVKVIVDSGLTVVNPTKAMISWMQDNLILPNPDFYKKLKLGKWTGNTPEKIFLYERIGDNFRLPFGSLIRFWNAFKSQIDFDVRIHSRSSDFKYRSNLIKLYDYQQRAKDSALRKKNGILVMPCGSGKTQTALDIIATLGGNCLWLTHTQDLLNQSLARAKSAFGNLKYGRISSGKVDISEGLTFATVQTMCKIDLAQYKNVWDVIIIDECQHCCGSPTKVTQFYKVVSNLSARYKFGLTATPRRADGLEKSMFALLGDIICEVSRSEVDEKTCPVHVLQIETGYRPDYNAVLLGDGTINYAALVDDLTENEKRKEMVLDVLKALEPPFMVLGNRVKYLQDLCNKFDSDSERSICLSTLGASKSAKLARKEALLKLNNGELDAIFATYQLAKEGLDVPNLKYVVFATPEQDETTVIQSAGRVGRKSDGKEYGTVIDLIDDFGMYRGWAKKRERHYKKINAEIIASDIDVC